MQKWNEKKIVSGSTITLDAKKAGEQIRDAEELADVFSTFNSLQKITKLAEKRKKTVDEIRTIGKAFQANRESLPVLKLLLEQKVEDANEIISDTFRVPGMEDALAALEQAKIKAQEEVGALTRKITQLELVEKIGKQTQAVEEDARQKKEAEEAKKLARKTREEELAREKAEKEAREKARLEVGMRFEKDLPNGEAEEIIIEGYKPGKKPPKGAKTGGTWPTVTYVRKIFDKTGKIKETKASETKERREFNQILANEKFSPVEKEAAAAATTPEKVLPQPSAERAYEITTEYNSVLLDPAKWNAAGPDRVAQQVLIDKLEKEVPLTWLEKNLHLYKRMKEMVLMEEGARMTHWRNERDRQEKAFAETQKDPTGEYIRATPDATGKIILTSVTTEEYEKLKKDITLLNDELFTYDRTKVKNEIPTLQAELAQLQREVAALEALGTGLTQPQKTELTRKRTELTQKTNAVSQKEAAYLDLLAKEAAHYTKIGAADSEAAHLLKQHDAQIKIPPIEAEIAQKKVERDEKINGKPAANGTKEAGITALEKKERDARDWEALEQADEIDFQNAISKVIDDLFQEEKHGEVNIHHFTMPRPQPASGEVLMSFEVHLSKDWGGAANLLKKGTGLLDSLEEGYDRLTGSFSRRNTIGKSLFKTVMGKEKEKEEHINITIAFKADANGKLTVINEKLKVDAHHEHFRHDVEASIKKGFALKSGKNTTFAEEMRAALNHEVDDRTNNDVDHAKIRIENGNLKFYAEDIFEGIKKGKNVVFTAEDQQKLNDLRAEKSVLDREITRLEGDKTTLETTVRNEGTAATTQANAVDRSYRTPPTPTPPTTTVPPPPVVTPPAPPTGPTSPIVTPATPQEVEDFITRVSGAGSLSTADEEFYNNNKTEIDAKRIELADKAKEEYEQLVSDLEQNFKNAGEPTFMSELKDTLGEEQFTKLLGSLTSADMATFIQAARKLVEEAPLEPETDPLAAIEDRRQQEVDAVGAPTLSDLNGKTVDWHGVEVLITSDPVDTGEYYELETGAGVPIKIQKGDEDGINLLLAQIGKTPEMIAKLKEIDERYNKEKLPYIESAKEKAARDPLFAEAARALITSTGIVSQAVLMRKLRINFDKATELLNQLTKAGIITPAQGKEPAKINASSKEELEAKLITLV
jgi:hypothetical protein